MDRKVKIIQQIIKDKHYSLTEFARNINMPYSTLTSILKNGLENGSVANVTKICEGVGLTYDGLRELTGEWENPNSKRIPTDIQDLIGGADFDKDIREIVELLPTASRADFKMIYDLVRRLTD